MLMGASYIPVCLSQELPADLIWNSTKLVAMPSDEALPSIRQRYEWQALLPVQPSLPIWRSWFQRGGKPKPTFLTWSEEASLRNAKALQNRLQLAGWLDAEVQSSWTAFRGGAQLELAMQCGARWKVEAIDVDVEGTGLAASKVRRHAALEEGMPFSQTALQEARDRIARGIQQDGYATFHAGHVSFDVDTLGAALSKGVQLTIVCSKRKASSIGALMEGESEAEERHPLVHLGEVFWNGQDPKVALEAGGLRSDVWWHVGTFQPGGVYNPSTMKDMYLRLSRIRSVDRVQMSTALRWDTLAQTDRNLRRLAVMDVDYTLVQKPSHDLGVELDLVRNDARYGPKLSTTLQHRNPRGWGAENAWEVAFGYVAVAPFSTLSTANFLNSGEWALQWSTRQIGIAPLPLSMFRPSNAPQTVFDVGWNREVWPEFTRSQIHIQHDYSLTENAARNARWHFSPIQVSFVNLTNKAAAFSQWLVDQDNPLIQARFNNHLNVGSALGWASDWSLRSWKGRIDMQASWAGGLSQRMAQAWASPESFDGTTGAWLVTSDVPLIQYQRILSKVSGERSSRLHPRLTTAANVLVGFANAGKTTPSLPLEQAFFSGGANGIRGWRLRTLGPGNTEQMEDASGIAGVGDIRLDLQFEQRMRINDFWQVALFSDMGNVWLHGESAPEASVWSLDLRGFGWGAGLGVRMDLEFFLLRLDGGLRIHDPGKALGKRWVGQGPWKGALHLGLGLPF